MSANIFLIGSSGLGSGSKELGGQILANFLRILADKRELPEYIILWNEGVKIALSDSSTADHLKKLEQAGVEIIVCQTCIEYFGLEGQAIIGRIGTMGLIQDILLSGEVLTL